jgi:hypothetical protein
MNSNENGQALQPGDIVMNPGNRTTMWRVLESKDDQIRLVRANKEGGLHGLVKKPTGTWKPAHELSNFTVVGHTDKSLGYGRKQATASTGAKPGRKPSKAAPSGQIPAPKQVGRKPRTATSESDDRIYRFLETTFSAMQKGLRELHTR